MDENYQELTPVPEPAPKGVVLTELAAWDLKRAAKWAKFLAIIGFVITAIIAVAAFSVGALFSTIGNLNPAAAPLAAMSSVFTVVYLLIAAVLFIIHLFLYQFASRTVTGVDFSDSLMLERGIHRLQSYFKALGIIMIIYLAFAVLGICLMLLGLSMVHH